MDTSFDFFDDTMLITVDKELDQHNADIIKSLTDQYIYAGKVKNVIFDFENTTFCDSSGIGVIMGRYKLLRNIDGKVYVTGVKEAVDKILSLSGMYKIVTKCDNIDEIIDK